VGVSRDRLRGYRVRGRDRVSEIVPPLGELPRFENSRNVEMREISGDCMLLICQRLTLLQKAAPCENG
jgi:hypothetical protein